MSLKSVLKNKLCYRSFDLVLHYLFLLLDKKSVPLMFVWEKRWELMSKISVKFNI